MERDPASQLSGEGEGADVIDFRLLTRGEIQEAHLVPGRLPLTLGLPGLFRRWIDVEGKPPGVVGEAQAGRGTEPPSRHLSHGEPMFRVVPGVPDHKLTVPLGGAETVGEPTPILRENAPRDPLPRQHVLKADGPGSDLVPQLLRRGGDRVDAQGDEHHEGGYTGPPMKPIPHVLDSFGESAGPGMPLGKGGHHGIRARALPALLAEPAFPPQLSPRAP